VPRRTVPPARMAYGSTHRGHSRRLRGEPRLSVSTAGKPEAPVTVTGAPVVSRRTTPVVGRHPNHCSRWCTWSARAGSLTWSRGTSGGQ
jgi:hypothetical protein